MTEPPAAEPDAPLRTLPRALHLAAAYVIAVVAGFVASGDTGWGFAVLAGAMLLSFGLVIRALWLAKAGGAPAILRTVLMMGIGYMVFVVIGSIGGCSSATLPEELTEAERKLIVESHLPVTVGVADSKDADRLLAALRATGLFDRVELMKDLSSPPGLVATSEGAPSGAAIIPFASILSAGVVPTRFKETAGLRFRLAPPGDGKNGVSVWYAHVSDGCLGWASGLLNCLPSRTSDEVAAHPRFHAAMALQITVSADAIRALLPK